MDFHKPLGTASTLIMIYGLKMLLAIVIFVVGRWLTGVLTKFIKHWMAAGNLDETVVDLVIGVSYDADFQQAKEELNSPISQEDRILSNPEPTFAELALADSSVKFAVRPRVISSDYWPVFCDLLEKIKIRFDEVGIDIPYPQMDLHMMNTYD